MFLIFNHVSKKNPTLIILTLWNLHFNRSNQFTPFPKVTSTSSKLKSTTSTLIPKSTSTKSGLPQFMPRDGVPATKFSSTYHSLCSDAQSKQASDKLIKHRILNNTSALLSNTIILLIIISLSDPLHHLCRPNCIKLN